MVKQTLQFLGLLVMVAVSIYGLIWAGKNEVQSLEVISFIFMMFGGLGILIALIAGGFPNSYTRKPDKVYYTGDGKKLYTKKPDIPKIEPSGVKKPEVSEYW